MGVKLTSIRVDANVWKKAKIQAIKNEEPLHAFLNRAILQELTNTK